jgi:UDP-hydrolysing UDP-N-acetyl-D-glucosamine 2-epimerase
MDNTRPLLAVFTGNRADFGLLTPVLTAIQQHATWQLQVLIGADHIASGSITEITACGYHADWIQPCDPVLADAPSAHRMAQATAQVLGQLSQFWRQSDRLPSLLLVLGDRFETFGAVQAAFYHNIPIAHIGGGDVTQGGCVDDTLRDLISDMASLHLVSNVASANRLIQKGYPSSSVITTGSTVIDTLQAHQPSPKVALCQAIGFNPSQPIALFTQHPIASEGQEATINAYVDSLAALDRLHQSHHLQTIVTHPNTDAFGLALGQSIKQVKRLYPHMHVVPSLGHHGYLSWLAACQLVVGNSSSGLIETPFFKIPCVNIGPRQLGRLQALNIVNCAYGEQSVYNACVFALEDPGLQQTLLTLENPYGQTPASPLIVDSLANIIDRATPALQANEVSTKPGC